jgi:hypothetical protein
MKIRSGVLEFLMRTDVTGAFLQLLVAKEPKSNNESIGMEMSIHYPVLILPSV